RNRRTRTTPQERRPARSRKHRRIPAQRSCKRHHRRSRPRRLRLPHHGIDTERQFPDPGPPLGGARVFCAGRRAERGGVRRPANSVAGRGILNAGYQTVLPAAASRTGAGKRCCRPRYPERGPSNSVAGRGILNGGHQMVLPAAASQTGAIKWCCRPPLFKMVFLHNKLLSIIIICLIKNQIGSFYTYI